MDPQIKQPVLPLNKLVWPFVVLVIALAAFYFKPWQQQPLQTISITATGTAKVVPDIATISATIETKGISLDTARKQNAEAVSNLVEKLKALGIDEKDIKTQYIAGGESFEPTPKPQNQQVSTTLDITLRNLKTSDSVLKTLTENGATNLYGPNLESNDQSLESAKQTAREEAVKNAKEQANQLAVASGRRLGKAIKISEENTSYPQVYGRGGADLAVQEQQIQPGQNEVTVNLSIDFSLK